jgi:hypothetical protein
MLTTDVATPLDTNFCKVETGYSYVVEKHMSIPGAMPWAFHSCHQMAEQAQAEAGRLTEHSVVNAIRILHITHRFFRKD